MVVCAPRWKNSFYNGYYLMNGVCYWSKANSKPDSDVLKLDPLVGKYQGYPLPKQPGQKNLEVYYYAYGETGISSHFTKNGGELLIGAPGIFDWSGSMIVYRNISTNQLNFRVPNPIHTPKQEPHDYFGYAISSGKFFTKPTEASGTLYVVGAPRAGGLLGKVFVLSLPPQTDRPLDIRWEKMGEQLGEYFGASLCVVDLNEDGLDDLLVGAPRYSPREPGKAGWDEGRLYVFLSRDEGHLQEVTQENRILGDAMHGANFGTSIAIIGDLNVDGYQDIAVGAPYGGGDGRGAVYIYHGHRNGIITKYSQRILGSDILKSIRGFGISLSNGMDIDGNSYNDVAVGAYISGHAVILRSRPVVTLRAELTADVNRISINTTSFQVASCISYSAENVSPAIDVHSVLTVESVFSMAYFPDHETNIRIEDNLLYNGVPDCKNYTVMLKPGKKVFSNAINIKFDFSLQDEMVLLKRKRSAYEYLCVECPVLDPNQPTSVTLRVPFATGCGEEDICRTDLKLHAELITAPGPLVLGNQSTVTVLMKVENKLDLAYLAHILIEAPRFLMFIRMPSSCSEESTPTLLRLHCDVGNPLSSQAGLKNVSLEFDLKNVPENTTELMFNITAASESQEQLPGDNNKLLVLGVHTSSDIRMVGSSNQDTLYFSKADDDPHEEITVIHSYEMRNYGPSKVYSVQLMFGVPISLSVGKMNITFSKLHFPQATLGGQPLFCTATDYEFFVDSSGFGSVASNEVDSNLPVSARKRRSADAALPTEVMTNGTLYLNCSQENTACVTVMCNNVGPFMFVQMSAKVQLRMTIRIRDLLPILGKRNVILLSTSGKILYQSLPNALHPSSGSSLRKAVRTLFQAEISSPGVELWILVLAIVTGLLLFLLLVLLLIKLGFFHRTKKEELVHLKNKIELQYDDDDDNDEEDDKNRDQAL